MMVLGSKIGRTVEVDGGWLRLRGGRRAPVVGVKMVCKDARIANRGRCEVLKAAKSTDVPPAKDYGNARSCPIQGCWEDLTVGDIMCSKVVTVTPDDSIFRAMELLVEQRCSGLAVIDEDRKVLGVVSAYDVLALDCTPGQLDKSDGFFPPINRCINEFDGDRNAMWKDFLGLRKSIDKAKSTLVGDSMHETCTILASELMPKAADLIVQKKLHRVFVVDEEERLTGVISRGDIMRATVNNFRFYVESSSA